MSLQSSRLSSPRPSVGLLLSSGVERLAEISHLALWSVRERRPLMQIVGQQELGEAVDSLRRNGHSREAIDVFVSPLGGDSLPDAPRTFAVVEPLSGEWERRRTVLAHLLEKRGNRGATE